MGKFPNKIAIIYFILPVLFSGIFFVRAAHAGTLSCTVATTCPTGTVIWRMSGTNNAQAELPSQSLYTQLVCCSGVTGLGTACTGTFATALKLSGTTNAHSEQNSQVNYANNACISVPSGGSVSVGYQATNCTGFDTTLGSMSGLTNAHTGDGTAYTTKICGTAAGAASLTFVVTTDNFSNLNPGTPVFATSTLSVDTTNSTGWNVTLYGNDVDVPAGNATMDLTSDLSVNISDKTPQWIPGLATTTAGNAASIASGQDFLAFRVMSASGTPSFRSTAWWGTSDAMFNVSQLWAGIASSTVERQIGRSSVSSGGAPALNTALYYLDVPLDQQDGTYSGSITYTAVVNP